MNNDNDDNNNNNNTNNERKTMVPMSRIALEQEKNNNHSYLASTGSGAMPSTKPPSSSRITLEQLESAPPLPHQQQQHQHQRTKYDLDSPPSNNNHNTNNKENTQNYSQPPARSSVVVPGAVGIAGPGLGTTSSSGWNSPFEGDEPKTEEPPTSPNRALSPRPLQPHHEQYPSMSSDYSVLSANSTSSSIIKQLEDLKLQECTSNGGETQKSGFSNPEIPFGNTTGMGGVHSNASSGGTMGIGMMGNGGGGGVLVGAGLGGTLVTTTTGQFVVVPPDHELAVAAPIDEDDSDDDKSYSDDSTYDPNDPTRPPRRRKKRHSNAVIMHAIEYDPNSKPPVWKHRRFRLYMLAGGFILLCVIVLCIALAVLSTTNHNKLKGGWSQSTPTMAPTSMAPTSPLENQYAEYLIQAMGGASTEFEQNITTRGTLANQALQWILYEDERQLSLQDETLLQRYLLVLFYLQTSVKGPWRSCNPLSVFDGSSTTLTTRSANDNNNGNDDLTDPIYCTYLKREITDDDSVQFVPTPNKVRWLSSRSECEWEGVICSDVVDEELILQDAGDTTALNQDDDGADDDDKYPSSSSSSSSGSSTSQGKQQRQAAVVLGIDIFGQNLSGKIPTELATLPFLQKLSLGYNLLSGTIPPDYAYARHLIILEVHGNVLTGTIPLDYFVPRAQTASQQQQQDGQDTSAYNNAYLRNSPNPMAVFNIGDNQLSGTLDTNVGKMSNLKGLHIFQNNLQGTLPTELGLLSVLSFTRINGNEFTGPVPTELGKLNVLREMWFQENSFTGTIPSELGKLLRLKDLRLWGNANIGGTIPLELYQMTGLTRLQIREMNLHGTLSTLVGQLTDLQSLQVSTNHLTGTIPTELVQLTQLREAWFHFNDFSGDVPTDVCQNVNPEQLWFLQADCFPLGDAPNPCECCSSCCNRDTKVCDCRVGIANDKGDCLNS